MEKMLHARGNQESWDSHAPIRQNTRQGKTVTRPKDNHITVTGSIHQEYKTSVNMMHLTYIKQILTDLKEEIVLQ